MTDAPMLSVCMATYNGARHVQAQIDSILRQLRTTDELVIVDDASTDSTVELVASIGDHRIKLHQQSVNSGYVATFQEALKQARGQHLMLADQDDLWPVHRVEHLQRALLEGAIVAGNMGLIEDPARFPSPFGGNDWRLTREMPRRPIATILRMAACNAPYFGCAMGLRSDALDLVLPFPHAAREQHDVWIALIGLLTGSLEHVDDRVVLRRLHDANATGRPRGPHRILLGRLLFLQMLTLAVRRVRSARLQG